MVVTMVVTMVTTMVVTLVVTMVVTMENSLPNTVEHLVSCSDTVRIQHQRLQQHLRVLRLIIAVTMVTNGSSPLG